MYLLAPFLFLVAALVNIAFAATAEEWRSRSIYQVITDRFARKDGSTTAVCNTDDRIHCGGTWKGIINKLDYIQSMGFSAIWISPITANIEGFTAYGEAFHGYWQNDLYSVNAHFGSSQDLRDLSDAVHERGMYLMVDIVVNHNGWSGSPDTVDYSSFKPFNSPDDYHTTYCTINYDDSNSVQNCWLGDTKVPLPDLKTESETVASGYQTWIKELVSNYSIDGLRLDTALQVNPSFWPPFSTAASVFMTGEIFNGDPSTVCAYQTQSILPSVLNFPAYYAATAFFSTPQSDPAAFASGIARLQSACRDVTVLGSFTENHDLPRFAFLNGDVAAAKNLLVWTVLGDGIPIVYQGQEQHFAAVGKGSNGNDPWNREALWGSGYDTGNELFGAVQRANAVRSHAGFVDAGYWGSLNRVVQSGDGSVVVERGRQGKGVVVVLTNAGSGAGTSELVVSGVGFAPGTTVVEALGCTEVGVGNGTMTVAMEGGQPKVFFDKALLAGSGICKF